VRADFAALFEDVNIFGGEFRLGATGVVSFDEISEIKSAGKTGRAGSDDKDIGFKLFALDGHIDCILAECLFIPYDQAGIIRYSSGGPANESSAELK
jgi:hypothetical protein